MANKVTLPINTALQWQMQSKGGEFEFAIKLILYLINEGFIRFNGPSADAIQVSKEGQDIIIEATRNE